MTRTATPSAVNGARRITDRLRATARWFDRYTLETMATTRPRAR